MPVYWALHPDRMRALLHIPDLVHHQHRGGVAEVLDDVFTQVIAHPVGVPLSPAQQVLHTVRVGVTGMFGDRPTVLARQFSQQPEQEPTDPASCLDPTEPPCHPPQQPVSFGLPADRSYAVARGHRLII